MIAVMGPGTARAMIERNIVPDFIGKWGTQNKQRRVFCEGGFMTTRIVAQAEKQSKIC
jgi:hypothetical protein